MSEKRLFAASAFGVREEMRYGLLVILVSVTVFKVMMQIHEPHFDSLVDVNHGVIDGWPQWIAFQNRLLGPYTILLISKAGISYENALRIFMLMMTLVQNLVMFWLLMRMEVRPGKASLLVILFSFLFLGVQNFWIHSWDNIDLVLMTFFAYGILKSLPLRFFVLLFAIALLNRESALFISTYLVIDAFDYRDATQHWKLRLVSPGKLLAGVFLTATGIACVKFLRMYLFDHRHTPNRLFFGAPAALGNHLTLLPNLSDLFYHNFASINIINTVFVVGSTAYLLCYLSYYSATQFKALLVYLMLTANILTFGAVNETRMLIILLPFLIFFHVVIENIVQESRGVTREIEAD